MRVVPLVSVVHPVLESLISELSFKGTARLDNLFHEWL